MLADSTGRPYSTQARQGSTEAPRRSIAYATRTLCALLLLGLSAASPGLAVFEPPHAVGARPAALKVKIQLSANAIDFFQDGRPGLIDAHQKVEMEVVCFAQPWSVAAEATPLIKVLGGEQISPDRMFVRSNTTLPHPDVGAGPGFVPMDMPVVVAEGSLPVYETPLEFRLLTDWGDTPGIYKGDIQLTAMVRP